MTSIYSEAVKLQQPALNPAMCLLSSSLVELLHSCSLLHHFSWGPIPSVQCFNPCHAINASFKAPSKSTSAQILTCSSAIGHIDANLQKKCWRQMEALPFAASQVPDVIVVTKWKWTSDGSTLAALYFQILHISTVKRPLLTNRLSASTDSCILKLWPSFINL